MDDSTRIGDADRKKLVAQLNLAWQQGYLTEEMYTARAKQAGEAQVQGDVDPVMRHLPAINLPQAPKVKPSGMQKVARGGWPLFFVFLFILVAIGPSEYFAAIHNGEGYISLADKWVETVTIFGGTIGALFCAIGACLEIFDV